MFDWYKRWMLKRVIMALQLAVEGHGLKKEVATFAGQMEATFAMAGASKKNQQVTLTVTKAELGTFIVYMTQLHMTKLSLLTRARIGLVALLIDSGKLMPPSSDGDTQTPMGFASEQFADAKHSADEKRIKTIN